MANSILSSLLSTSKFKVYNEATGYPIWSKLQVKSVDVDAESSNAEEPLSVMQLSESSVRAQLLIQDIQSSKIIRPSRLRITALCSDISTLESIIALFNDVTSTLSISSKSVITGSMMITRLHISQSSEILSASKITIELEQSKPPAPNNFNPSQASDASTYGVRIQTPPSLTQTASGLYNKVQSFTSSI